MRHTAIRLAAFTLATLVVTLPAAAHEKGVLRPATRELVAGDSLTLTGERFSRSATLQILVIGATGRITLGEVRTDSTGRFATSVAVPAETAVGSYRLVAVATDGDEVATVDVVVRAGPPPREALVAHSMMEKPSATPLALERARSGPVTGGVIALAAVAAIAGIVLLRRRP